MVAALHQWFSKMVKYDVSSTSRGGAHLGPDWTFCPYHDHGLIAGEMPLVSTQCLTGN